MPQPLARGDVYLGTVYLRNPATNEIVPMTKRMVILHSDADLPDAIDFTFLICSTDPQNRPIRAYEVGFDPATIPALPAAEFDRPAKVDARWVRTERRDVVLPGAQLLGRLPSVIMDEVDEALVVGLSMGTQNPQS